MRHEDFAFLTHNCWQNNWSFFLNNYPSIIVTWSSHQYSVITQVSSLSLSGLLGRLSRALFSWTIPASPITSFTPATASVTTAATSFTSSATILSSSSGLWLVTSLCHKTILVLLWTPITTSSGSVISTTYSVLAVLTVIAPTVVSSATTSSSLTSSINFSSWLISSGLSLTFLNSFVCGCFNLLRLFGSGLDIVRSLNMMSQCLNLMSTVIRNVCWHLCNFPLKQIIQLSKRDSVVLAANLICGFLAQKRESLRKMVGIMGPFRFVKAVTNLNIPYLIEVCHHVTYRLPLFPCYHH